MFPFRDKSTKKSRTSVMFISARMARPLIIASVFFLAACGGEDSDGRRTVAAPQAAVGVGEPESGARCLASEAELAMHLPRSLFDMPANTDTFHASGRRDDRPPDQQATTLSIGYGERVNYRTPVTLQVADLSHFPALRGSIRETVTAASEHDAQYASVERGSAPGIGDYHYVISSDKKSETITVLSDGAVSVSVERHGVSDARSMLATLQQSGVLAALNPDCETDVVRLPAWLSDGPEPVDSEPETIAKLPAIPSLPPCDELLPPETVARICNVGQVVVQATPFEKPGENCNRYYRLPGEGDGLIFIVSNYSNVQTARSALAATSGSELNTRDFSKPADLGQTAERYVHEAVDPTYTVRFASHGALVELKSAESPIRESQICLDLDAVEALGSAVDAQLAEHADQ